MELYGQHSQSLPQKITINLIEVGLLAASYCILFQSGGNWMADFIGIENHIENTFHRQVIFAFNLVIFLRLGYMMFFLLKRAMPWEEAFSVPMAFALYYIGFSLLVLPSNHAVGSLDYFGIAIFIIGCVLNSGGEILRNQWKKHPENKGKIYTGGFFRYSRHINYFGDLLWVTGYAIITHNWWSALIPVMLFGFFAFYNAPKLDEYLQQKYGKEYEEYAAKTKMLIPFVY